MNRGTAGPAEIVAAAINENHRGDVVGDKTFGEGVQQKTIEMPQGGDALVLTVAKYETPDGKVIEDEGVTPTVMVGERRRARGDRWMTTSDEVAAAAPETAPAKPKMDDQLAKALALLKLKS